MLHLVRSILRELSALRGDLAAVRQLLEAPPRLMTTREVAHHLSVSPSKIRGLVKDYGHLPLPGRPVDTGEGQTAQLRWDPRTAAAWLAAASDLRRARTEAPTRPIETPAKPTRPPKKKPTRPPQKPKRPTAAEITRRAAERAHQARGAPT